MNGLPRHCSDWMPGVCHGPLLIVGAVAAVASAGAAIASSRVQAGTMLANAKAAQQNQQIAGMQSTFAQQQEGLKTGQEVGQQKAAIAASGVNIQSPTEQGQINATRTAGEVNQSNLQFMGAAAQNNLQTQEGVDKLDAGAATSGGYINAFSTLAGSASSVGNQWLQFKKYGTPSWSGIVGGG